MDDREVIINKIWKDIHGNDPAIFQFHNNIQNAYFYDISTNMIRSDNGFCVFVNLLDDELTFQSILSLILKLKNKLQQYYYNILNNKSNVINTLWNKIHDKIESAFYWNDGTKTLYYYDEKTDTIKSDNGFCVSVDKPVDKLDDIYISDLIYKLKTIIVLYHKYKLRQDLIRH